MLCRMASPSSSNWAVVVALSCDTAEVWRLRTGTGALISKSPLPVRLTRRLSALPEIAVICLGARPFCKASKSLVERIERLEEEKTAIAGDIKEVYAEAKANGFDSKILRKVITIRKKDHAEREEEEALLSLYMHALGMVPDTQRESSVAVAE